MHARLLAAAAVALVALPGTSHAQDILGRRDRTWTHTERVGSGDDVRIYAPVGTITVTEASGGSLEYRAEKIRGNVEDYGFVVRKGSSGVTICAVRDDNDECDEDGLHGGRRWRNWSNRAKLEITVAVPRGVNLVVTSGNGAVDLGAAVAAARVSSGNGRVRVRGVQGRVDASSGNGEVSVDDVTGPVKVHTGNGDVAIGTVNGPVEASSGNGDIIVAMKRLAGDGDLEFSSGNGRIEVTVPEDFSAEVEASSGNGRVTTDFPIRIVGRIVPSRLRGTIGDGKRRLTMHTGNGSMEIRKG